MSVTLRMYAVGFGDCFLLTVPRDGDRPWRMLVDCGVHFRGPGEHDMSAIIDDIVATSAADGPAHLDVVLASHRHQDHISGFGDPRWADVSVGEVWLPWTENPADSEAHRLRLRLDAAARSVALLLRPFGAAGEALALNSLSNERAMTTLRSGFAGQPVRHYLSAEEPEQRELAGLDGGLAYVLGPSRSREAIRSLEPPAVERWLSAAAASATRGPVAESPFPAAYRIGDRAAYEGAYPHLAVPDKLLQSMLLERDNGLAAAAWLDKKLNNTSLVVLLEIGEVRILLAGDAQWGSWQNIMKSPDARTLLSRTTVYKVSHHGSHNGSPKTLVSTVLPAALTSVVSVRKMEDWPKIPKTNLLDALGTPGRTLIRADELARAPNSVRQDPSGLWSELDLD